MSELHNCAVVAVGLRPSPVSQENACIGVIVKCMDTGFFGYRLVQNDENAIRRIVGFFPRYGQQNLMRALEWASHDIEFAMEGERKGRAAFANLIRPRENVIRYTPPFVVVTDDPAAELSRQYEMLVSMPRTPCNDLEETKGKIVSIK